MRSLFFKIKVFTSALKNESKREYVTRKEQGAGHKILGKTLGKPDMFSTVVSAVPVTRQQL